MLLPLMFWKTSDNGHAAHATILQSDSDDLMAFWRVTVLIVV